MEALFFMTGETAKEISVKMSVHVLDEDEKEVTSLLFDVIGKESLQRISQVLQEKALLVNCVYKVGSSRYIFLWAKS